MKTCTLCQQEVTSQMIRQGGAISRGAEVYHRECHRTHKPGRGRPAIPEPAPLAVGTEGSAMQFSDTSYPDITLGVEYASIWRRLGAHIIDSFILNILVIVPSFAFGFMAGMMGATEAGLGLTAVGWMIGMAIPLAYCLWFWTKKNGATPGKMALGIQIVGEGNEPLTGGQSFIRYLGYIPSGLIFGLGYLAMLWDEESRCWHDRMANTRVIRV